MGRSVPAGWPPKNVRLVQSSQLSYAEMDKSEKNAISHRRKALDELCRFIK